MNQLIEQLLHHLRGMWLRRFWGLGAAWAVAIVGVAATLLAPAKYEASARVFLDTESVLKPLMEGLAVEPKADLQVKILTDTLLSRPNMEKLISFAALEQGAAAPKDHNRLIEDLTREIKLTGSTRDNLFSLSYRDVDPGRAKRVIDAMMKIFVESGPGNKRSDTAKAIAFLDAQIKEYEVVLGKAEERLKDFKLQNLDQLSSSQDSVATMLALDNDIQKARTELYVAEQRRETLRAQLATEDPMFVSERVDRGAGVALPAGADPIADLDARADALRRNLDELLRKYTEEHPDVVGTRRILADIHKQREVLVEETKRGEPRAPVNARREPNLVYQQLKVALVQSDATVAELRTRLSQLESRYNRIRAAAKLRPEFEKDLAQLNRDYEVQKTNFEKLILRREQAKLTGDLRESGTVDFRLIEPPRVSPKPVSPDRLMLLVAVLVLSLGTGAGVSFIVNQVFPKVSSLLDLRRLTGLSVLGSVSIRPTPAVVSHRKRARYAFVGGLTGLGALFGVALTGLLVAGRMV